MTTHDRLPTLDQLRLSAFDTDDSPWACVGELPHPENASDDAALDGGHLASIATTPHSGPAVIYAYDHDDIRLHVHMAGAGPTQPSTETPTPGRWQLTIDGRASDAMGEVTTSTVEHSVEAIHQLTVNAATTIHALAQAATDADEDTAPDPLTGRDAERDGDA